MLLIMAEAFVEPEEKEIAYLLNPRYRIFKVDMIYYYLYCIKLEMLFWSLNHKFFVGFVKTKYTYIKENRKENATV